MIQQEVVDHHSEVNGESARHPNPNPSNHQ